MFMLVVDVDDERQERLAQEEDRLLYPLRESHRLHLALRFFTVTRTSLKILRLTSADESWTVSDVFPRNYDHRAWMKRKNEAQEWKPCSR